MKYLYFIFFLLLFAHIDSFGQLNFTQSSPFGLPGFLNKAHMASADFNGDGVVDLASTAGTNQLVVTIIDDKSVPGTSIPYLSSQNNMAGIVTGDFDGDDDVDVIVTHQSLPNRGFSFFKNNGDGTFLFVGFAPQVGFTDGYRNVISLDYDQDGDLDFATCTSVGLSIRLIIYQNNGLGSFTPVNIPLITDVLANDYHLASGIFDNTTQKMDIIFVNGNATVFRVTDLDATPSVSTIYTETLFITPSFRHVAVGDFNLNGNMDLALSSGGIAPIDNAIRMLSGNGDGTFTTGSDFVAPASSNAGSLTPADLDNDGDIDLIWVLKTVGDIRCYVNSGGFITPPFFTFSIVTETITPNVGAVATGDFNMDGVTDFAVTRTSGDEHYLFLNDNTGGAVPVPDACVALNATGFLLKNISPLLTKTSELTIEGWFKPNLTGANQYIFYNGRNGTNGFGLYIDASSEIFLYIEGFGDFATGLRPNNGLWNHFALVRRNDTRWGLYINGVESTTLSATNTPIVPSETIIGAVDNGGNFPLENGLIQEFRFWNIALDVTTIRKWMNVKLNKSHPKSFMLNSYLPMDDLTIPPIPVTKDIAYTINTNSLYKVVTFENGADWSGSNAAPIGDNGSSELATVTGPGIVNLRNKVGVELNFTDDFSPLSLPNPTAPLYPDGQIVVSRLYDEQADDFYPTTTPAPLITIPPQNFSKVNWIIRDFSPDADLNFNALAEIIFNIKDNQFRTGLYPILNTPSDPNPLAAGFKIFTRPINSNDQADWIYLGEGTGFGSLRSRRPSNNASEFGRTTGTGTSDGGGMFTIGADLSILPVHLVSFTGKKVDRTTNMLEWQTSFEYNNEIFEIEKSYDAKNYFKIGFVEGQRNSNKNKKYTFEDKYATESAYYRLIQKDVDGKKNHSKVVFIAIDDVSAQTLKVYPNPVSNVINLDVQVYENEEFELNIQNPYGEKILVLQGTKSIIEKDLNKQIQDLPKGLYIIKLSNPYKTYSTKFIKN
ncbi:MAG: FG-GAP-like repeat-containing protein [Raineya sp.]|jgi:hypothetical protein|nr:FG-GAP-like repeat-containing protein [Raineya sp.]